MVVSSLRYSSECNRDEQADIAALNQQRNLLVMLVPHIAELRQAFQRRAIHGYHHVARLNASPGGFSS